MPPVDRSEPIRADYSESSYSLMEFMREFPDDAACLDWLWRNRYSEDGSHAYCPKCDRERKFHKVKERPAWDCDSCGYHMHPLAGTIFAKSSTSLQLWFFAIHLMTSTRCGVSAKQLERELGVTYKTAWRMFTLIRNKLMIEDRKPLTGYVEVDETSVDGKPRVKHSMRTDPEARSKAAAGSRRFCGLSYLPRPLPWDGGGRRLCAGGRGAACGLATFLRLPKNSRRFGTGTSYPFGVRSVGSGRCSSAIGRA